MRAAPKAAREWGTKDRDVTERHRSDIARVDRLVDRYMIEGRRPMTIGIGCRNQRLPAFEVCDMEDLLEPRDAGPIGDQSVK